MRDIAGGTGMLEWDEDEMWEAVDAILDEMSCG